VLNIKTFISIHKNKIIIMIVSAIFINFYFKAPVRSMKNNINSITHYGNIIDTYFNYKDDFICKNKEKHININRSDDINGYTKYYFNKMELMLNIDNKNNSFFYSINNEYHINIINCCSKQTIKNNQCWFIDNNNKYNILEIGFFKSILYYFTGGTKFYEEPK